MTACGGSGDGGTPAPTTGTLGGTVSGLTQSGLVLADGGQTLAVVSGATSFSFSTSVTIGQAYAVSVQTQPTGQNCAVSQASGTMTAAGVKDVAVACTTIVVPPSAHAVGGTISGLTSSGLVLLNGSDSLTLQAGATSFTMPTTVMQGSTYQVTVGTQPTGLTCNVAQGSGTMGASDVGNVAIACHGGYLTSTLAGSDVAGAVDGVGANASFNRPAGLAVDAQGNVIVADYANHLIRRITAAGTVTTVAGSGTAGSSEGQGTAASFNSPSGVAVDASGDVFVADSGNNKIRRIVAGGTVSTLAGTGAAGSSNGAGNVATFSTPTSLVLDSTGKLQVADTGNSLLRVVATDGSTSTRTLTGSSSLLVPQSLGIDAQDDLYLTQATCVVLKISAAGNAQPVPAADCTFGFTQGPAFNAQVASGADGTLYIADDLGQVIRRVTPDGVMSILAGTLNTAGSTDGTVATFSQLSGIAVDTAGNVYVTDGNRVRKLTPQ